MRNWRVVRLNAALFPIDAYEASLYRQYGLQPVEAEAATPDDILAHVAECDALFAVSVQLPKPVIAGLQNCRVISRLGAGTDKIAVDLATERGILVTNVPDFCAEEQADHTLALLLMLARQMPQMSAQMAAGTYSDARAMSRLNQRLRGQTLGLVGFGHSARLVAARARAFGLRVIATRRRTQPDPAAEALGVTLTDLDTVLRESDYVSLHAPLLPDTYHLIDAAAIAKIKPGAYFINTARGALVEEPALVEALRSGRLAGAGLDTFESIDVFGPESGPATSNPLFALDNVILTPHVAAGSVQAMQAVSRGGVENVVAVLSGYWPQPGQIVNAEVAPRWPLRAHDPALFEARKVAA